MRTLWETLFTLQQGVTHAEGKRVPLGALGEARRGGWDLAPISPSKMGSREADVEAWEVASAPPSEPEQDKDS